MAKDVGNTRHATWPQYWIPDGSDWYRRRHGEANYHMTQFLSNRWCYRKYLFRIGKEGLETSPIYPDKMGYFRQMVFECKRFEKLKEDLKKACYVNLLPLNIVEIMMQSEEMELEMKENLRRRSPRGAPDAKRMKNS